MSSKTQKNITHNNDIQYEHSTHKKHNKKCEFKTEQMKQLCQYNDLLEQLNKVKKSVDHPKYDIIFRIVSKIAMFDNRTITSLSNFTKFPESIVQENINDIIELIMENRSKIEKNILTNSFFDDDKNNYPSTIRFLRVLLGTVGYSLTIRNKMISIRMQ